MTTNEERMVFRQILQTSYGGAFGGRRVGGIRRRNGKKRRSGGQRVQGQSYQRAFGHAGGVCCLRAGKKLLFIHRRGVHRLFEIRRFARKAEFSETERGGRSGGAGNEAAARKQGRESYHKALVCWKTTHLSAEYRFSGHIAENHARRNARRAFKNRGKNAQKRRRGVHRAHAGAVRFEKSAGKRSGVSERFVPRDA